ncbi:MAG: thioredoxin family protein [Candidatus Diapherotrites archaeon]|uniref:Thioredoxin family protein n=1 Tax=Candidatus Iainarchaeum sp. TaxID=3101447 RepID=A0A8T3YKE9_9ARCH|nr:thioredoxin family protein [Candidatus Diapherotrites archaeon]
MKEVLVLSTPGCAPCAQAKKILQHIALKVPLEIHEINVMGRPDLLEKYRFTAMPGIVIDGKLEFSGVPSEKELMEKLINKEKIR